MSIRIVMPDKDGLEKQMRDVIIAKIPQVEISVNCPYAKYVEFGSDPAVNGSGQKYYDYACRDYITGPHKRIRDWAQHRLGLDDKERKRVGDAIYHSIMDEGMLPSPFIRPAIHKVLGMIESGHLDTEAFDKSKSYSENVCELIKFEMLKILRERGYDRDDRVEDGGMLMTSITVRPLYNSSIQKRQVSKNKYPPDVWMSTEKFTERDRSNR